MIILYDTYNEILIFKMEKKDWKNEKGKRFVKEIIQEIDNDERLEIQYKREILWNINKTVIRKFYEIYKKYYDSRKQKVIFL